MQRLINSSVIRYIVVGGFTFALELSILFILVKALHVNTPLSVTLSFLFGLVVSFLLQKVLAFKNSSFNKSVVSRQSAYYLLLVLANYLFTVGVVVLFENYLGVFIARTIALIITTIWNFFAYKYFIFSKKPTKIRFSTKHTRSVVIMFTSSIALFGFSALFLLAFLGAFVKPGADDLYYMSFGEHDPVFKWFFLNGRITSIVIYGLLYPIPHILKFIPLLSIIIVSLSFYTLVYSLLKNYTLLTQPRRLAFISALTLSLFSIITLPGIYSSVFWFAATPVHTWSIASIVLLTGVSILLINKPRVYGWQLILFLIGVTIAGCLGEFSAAALFMIGLAGLIFGLIRKNVVFIKTYGATLIGALFSLGILFLSPGAISRRERFDPLTRDHLLNTPSAIMENLSIVPQYINNPSTFLLLFIMSIAAILFISVKKYSSKLPAIIIALSIVGLFGYLVMNYVILWIGLRELQPVRSYFSTTVALAIFFTALGVSVGLWLKNVVKKNEVNSLILSLLSVTVIIFTVNFAYLPTLYSFSNDITYRYHEWNAREEVILNKLSKNDCSTPIKSLYVRGMWSENNNPKYWVNDSLRLYYNIPCSPVAEPLVHDIYFPPG